MKRKHWAVLLAALAVVGLVVLLRTPHGWKFALGVPYGLIAYHRCQYALGRSSAAARRRRAIRETYRRDEQ